MLGDLNPEQKVRVWENRILTYDLDLLNQQTRIKVRLLVQEGADIIQTPNPPLYQARLSTERTWTAPKRNGLEPRKLTACFQNPTDPTKETTRTVYNPYRPDDFNWKALTRELIEYPNVLAVEYKGETHESRYEEFVP